MVGRTGTNMKLIVATKKGKVVKIDPKHIKSQRRGGYGSTLVRLREGDEVASVVLQEEEID